MPKLLHFIRVLAWNATHNRDFPQAEIFTFFKVKFSARVFSLSIYVDPEEISEGLEWEIDGYNFYEETSRLDSAKEIHSWLEKKAQERHEKSRDFFERLKSQGVGQATFDSDDDITISISVPLEEQFINLLGGPFIV